MQNEILVGCKGCILQIPGEIGSTEEHGKLSAQKHKSLECSVSFSNFLYPTSHVVGQIAGLLFGKEKIGQLVEKLVRKPLEWSTPYM